MISVILLIVNIIWIIFIAFWIVSAFNAKKNVRTGKWWIGIGIRFVFFICVVWFIRSSNSRGAHIQANMFFSNPATVGPASIVGLILCAGGIALAIWARVYLGRNWGMPMSLKENPELVTSGPYRFIRHPIYTGVLLAMLGTGLIVGLIWLIIFVVSLVYFIYAATVEQKIMMRQFPDQYSAYKKRTKMLIPFIF